MVIEKSDEQCFGCDPAEFKKSVEASMTYRISGPGLCIISVLSDAQAMLELGFPERARQEINKAKYLVDAYLPSKERQEVLQEREQLIRDITERNLRK